MNIVFLLGNGFDKNLDLPTSYREFYEYYLHQHSDTKVVNELKHAIQTDLDNGGKDWADLEKALGQHAATWTSCDEACEACRDINRHLKAYLSGIDLSQVEVGTIGAELYLPTHYFSRSEQQRISNICSFNLGAQDIVDVITFNYTKTLERLLPDNSTTNRQKLYVRGSRTGYLGRILHIHGTLDDSEVILGVNDPSQIANESLRDNPRALGWLVKPTMTLERGDMIDTQCEQLITGANVICMHGLSMGDTDTKWWRLIGEHLPGLNLVLLFYFDTDAFDFTPDIRDHERQIRENFLRKCLPDDDRRSRFDDKVLIAYKSSIFRG